MGDGGGKRGWEVEVGHRFFSAEKKVKGKKCTQKMTMTRELKI